MKKIILLLLFSNIFILNAQNNIFNESNQLKYKEEESYKNISFKVEWFDLDKSELTLHQLLKSNTDIFYTSYNSSTKECTVESRLNIDRSYINSLLGTKGYKISEYSEKVNLLVQMPSVTSEDRAKMQAQRDYDNWLIENNYPKFINTGNLEKDNEDFAKRKKEWIQNNPEKYKSMTSKMPLTEQEKLEIIEKSK